MNQSVSRLEKYLQSSERTSPDEVIRMIHDVLESLGRDRMHSRNIFDKEMNEIQRMMQELSHA